jgi:putative endonuclease
MKAAPKNYYCYLFRCKDGTLYAGITDNLAKRETMHNNGTGSKYVHSRGGGFIIYSEELKTRPEALAREAAIKRLTKAEKEKLISII